MSRVDENAELGRVIAEGAESGLMSDKLAELLYIQDICKSLAVIADHIQSTRPTGHWILLDECSNSGYYCSECHKKVIKEGWSNTVKKVKYCPNCGAKMIESEDKEYRLHVADINVGKMAESEEVEE